MKEWRNRNPKPEERSQMKSQMSQKSHMSQIGHMCQISHMSQINHLIRRNPSKSQTPPKESAHWRTNTKLQHQLIKKEKKNCRNNRKSFSIWKNEAESYQNRKLHWRRR